MRPSLFLAILGTALSAVAQQPAELPSAPSATLEKQQQKDAAADAPPPQRSSPALGMPAIPKDTTAAAPPPKPAAPQSDPKNTPAPDTEVPTIKVGVNEVNVIFTVTDKRNHFVKDLNQPDFKFVDDGKPVATVRD